MPDILLVEDNRNLANLYIAYLEDENYNLTHVETGAAALTELNRKPPEIVLLDLMLPDMDGMDILNAITKRGKPSTVLVMTAYGSIDRAVSAMRGGAYDFLVKPFNAERLIFTLRNALERQQLTHIIRTYEESAGEKNFAGFIGSTVVMQAVYRIIKSAAPSRAPVFITGESGTGKEVCAQAIHQLSPRKSSPFVAINCAALPLQLIESELFGHVKGAFTGAVSNRAGAVQRASGGTLFLDEITEMDFELQAKLLRFVQTGTVQPIGSNKVEKVDVRIICATNRDPLQAVDEGRLREDLFYRLHVIPINMPTLTERKGDILDIGQYFLDQYNREENKHFTGFSDRAKRILVNYDWPGNVRQLQNVIRQIIVLNDNDVITAEMISPPLPNQPAASEPSVAQADADVSPSPSLAAPPKKDKPQSKNESQPSGVSTGSAERAISISPAPNGNGAPEAPTTATEAVATRPLWQVERDAIQAAIKAADGNVTLAAARLEISPSTIYRKLQSWQSHTH